jgi:translation elongation factor EF-G
VDPSLAYLEHEGKLINIIDAPGYPDFIGGAITATSGADAAVLVISASAGIEVNTRRVFAEAGKAGVGRMIIINRMDADNIDFPKLLKSIKELFGGACVLLSVPLGQERARETRAPERSGGSTARSEGTITPAERLVLKKLLAIRFEKRTPPYVAKELSEQELFVLRELERKGFVNVFRGQKYKDGVFTGFVGWNLLVLNMLQGVAEGRWLLLELPFE